MGRESCNLLRVLRTSSAKSLLSLQVLVGTSAVFRNALKCLSLNFMNSSVRLGCSKICWHMTQMRSLDVKGGGGGGAGFDDDWEVEPVLLRFESGVLLELDLFTQNWQNACLQKLHIFYFKHKNLTVIVNLFWQSWKSKISFFYLFLFSFDLNTVVSFSNQLIALLFWNSS